MAASSLQGKIGMLTPVCSPALLILPPSCTPDWEHDDCIIYLCLYAIGLWHTGWVQPYASMHTALNKLSYAYGPVSVHKVTQNKGRGSQRRRREGTAHTLYKQS